MLSRYFMLLISYEIKFVIEYENFSWYKIGIFQKKRKVKQFEIKQKSNRSGEDVYTLFQSIWCHKLRFFGSFQDWVLFLSHTNTFFSKLEYFVKMQAINRFISRNISMVIFVFHRIRHFSKWCKVYDVVLYFIQSNVGRCLQKKGSIYFATFSCFVKKISFCS